MFSYAIEEINQGFNQLKDFFILREDDNFIIYDRKCDHNGGKLCSSEDSIICPLHNWEFKIEEGRYTNNVKKQPLDFEIIEENIVIQRENLIPELPKLNPQIDHEVKVSFFSHACLVIEAKDFCFATDPWVEGFAFAGGWWIDNFPPVNWIEKLNSMDFIYISHNHPDHLNEFTLSKIRKDMQFIVPNFESNSAEITLRKLGFLNIKTFDFQNFYQFRNSDLLLTIFKSGDFRDDSGLYITYGDFSFLTAVDSNDLNFSRHPKNLTVYASNFAGGASGFPICFDTFTETQKLDLIEKNRKAIKAVVSGIVRKIKPKYYLPYAGFFKERALRDKYIRENNFKNSVEEFYNITKETLTLDVTHKDEFNFLDSHLSSSSFIERIPDFPENPEEFMESTFENSSVNKKYIEDYFYNSGFKDQLILYLNILENETVTNKMSVDFSKEEIEVSFRDYDWEKIKEEKIHSAGIIRALQLEVRKDSFYWVLKNKKSWEDLSIGFQCRIDRVPDVYNVDFWFHFTNIYI